MRLSSFPPFVVMCAALLAPGIGWAQAQQPASRQGTENQRSPDGGDRQRDQQGDRSSSRRGSANEAQTPQRFVDEAIEAGFDEIVTGQMAEKKAQSDDVRDFAKDSVESHGKINQKLTKLAQEKGLTVPDFHAPDAQQKTSGNTPLKGQAGQAERSIDRKGNELESLTGAQFDKQYMALQVRNHERAVQMYENFARTAQDDDLKDFANDSLDTLRDHLKKAQDLNRKLSAKQ